MRPVINMTIGKDGNKIKYLQKLTKTKTRCPIFKTINNQKNCIR